MLAVRDPATDRRGLPWALIGVEAFAIFLSVLLAFGITEWRESRADARNVAVALERFGEEIRTNRAMVVERLPYHEEMMEGFARIVRADPAPSVEAGLHAAGWRGPRQVQFRESAWLAAQVTGAIALFDYDTAAIISGLYATQSKLDHMQNSFASTFALNPATLDSGGGAFMAGLSYFSIVVEFENNLVHLYDRALAHIDEVLD